LITAQGNCARVQTRINIDPIAIIAGFVTRIFWVQTHTENTVPACGYLASVRASVGIDDITVIANLSLIDASISAVLKTALRVAAIAIDLVAVIARLAAIDALIATALKLAG
jgi:hypothetical protein